MIKKIASFVFETANGPFVTWCCVALTLFAAFAMSPMLGVVGTVIIGVLLIVQVLAAIAYLIAFFISINEAKWMRALWQFLSGIAGIAFFVFGAAFAHVAKGVVNYAIWGTYEDGRRVSIASETSDLEFAVEYRLTHLFFAEYNKAIVFESGKRICLKTDTGGAGPFAVYNIGTNKYYLVEGLEHRFMRSDYIVDVADESVCVMVDEDLWANIPVEAQSINGGYSYGLTITTSTGDMEVKDFKKITGVLSNRRYLGLVCPNGEFEKALQGVEGAYDPYKEIVDPKWTEVQTFDLLPFKVECRNSLNNDSMEGRIVLKSGKKFRLPYPSGWQGMNFDVYELGEGMFYIVNDDGAFTEEFILNIKDEIFELRVDDYLVKVPENARRITGWVKSMGKYHLHVLNEDGVVVENDDGRPIGDILEKRRFLGRLTKDGKFIREKN